MPASTNNNESPIDFATVLAASVHDMKNGLFLLLQSIEQVAAEVESAQPRSRLADIHYETQRLNTGLMQLLSLYRQSHDHLPLNMQEVFLDDIADELVANNQFYARHHHVELRVDLVNEGSWYFDQHLVLVLLNDVVINALRYAKQQVQVKLGVDTVLNRFYVEVHDDGEGYPQSMIDSMGIEPGNMVLSAGRTGLGLYFSHLIAQAHQQNNKQGSIWLSNDSPLGGSKFTLQLP
ncbi:ATP-binding protein [Aliidiomarina taiwanensis]|uniref:histidine kinase n=1 Tax=Aliidiomarina taiwanensis TaxID=946228 RepID=A0A432X228_9GAMM|nr:HAMP domain-containing sensor histidine kinase [Aliidiomarina taiwanensis]RUO40508.1 ATP-binding protein [Aliidiomarina taiwanensis]